MKVEVCERCWRRSKSFTAGRKKTVIRRMQVNFLSSFARIKRTFYTMLFDSTSKRPYSIKYFYTCYLLCNINLFKIYWSLSPPQKFSIYCIVNNVDKSTDWICCGSQKNETSVYYAFIITAIFHRTSMSIILRFSVSSIFGSVWNNILSSGRI